MIPVAHAAEVKMTDVRTTDLTDNFTTFLDLTPAVVLLFEEVRVVLKCGFDVVGFISINLLSVDLVAEWAHK